MRGKGHAARKTNLVDVLALELRDELVELGLVCLDTDSL